MARFPRTVRPRWTRRSTPTSARHTSRPPVGRGDARCRDRAGGLSGVALARPSRRFERDRIVVVGAGLAGLSCAYELHRHGVRADVFEARERVGGRCWTARGFAYGQTAEHGGEFIDTRHIHIRRLAAKLGLRLDDTFAGYEAEGKPRRRLVVFEGERRTLAEVRDGIEPVVRRLARDAARIGSYRWDQANRAARAFDRITVAEWVDANVPGGIASYLGEYLQTIISSEYGLDAQDISAIALIDYFVAPYAGGPADERYHDPMGGTIRSLSGSPRSFRRVGLHLGSPLLSLSKRSDGSYALVFGGSARKVARRSCRAVPAVHGASRRRPVPRLVFSATPEAVVDDTLGFLDRWLPGVRASFNGTAWLDSWVDDPWVKGSYAAFLPGQWTSYLGVSRSARGERALRRRAHVDVQPGIPERRC